MFNEAFEVGSAHPIEEMKKSVFGQKFMHYCDITKDSINKCKKYENRYVCQNPLWHRSERKNLTSSPSNCSYSPEEGVWHE